MSKKTLRDIDLKGKRVLMRVDFNVPMAKDGSGKITDDTRVVAALPSIQYVLEQGGSLVLMSHLGRPKGKGYEAEFSLKPVADHLGELLGKPVAFAADCMNADAEVAALKPGDVLLLENTRFYKAEDGKVKKDDEKKGIHLTEEEYQAKKAELKEKRAEMAKKLASYGDVYANDAFGTAHRAHASTAVVADYLQPAVSGFLLEKEIKFLGDAVENPVRPFVAILGGAKVSDKLKVIKNLLGKVDTLIVGGGMAYTFLKAQGMKVGASLCEDEQLAYAKEMLDAAAAKGVKFLLPVDNVIADKFPAEKDASDIQMQVAEGDIPDGWRRTHPTSRCRLPMATSPTAGWASTSVRRRLRSSPTRSRAPRRSCGTARWAASSSRRSRRARSACATRWPRSRRTAARRSSAAATA